MQQDFRDLKEHCLILSEFILHPDVSWSEPHWWHVARCLLSAVGIVNVTYDSSKFHDKHFNSELLEYQEGSDAILSEFVKELMIFSFVWGSLESVLDNISPVEVPGHRGKINAACNYLKNEYEPEPPPIFYNALVDSLNDITSHLPYWYQRIFERFQTKHFVGTSGIGLYVIYGLRNMFAHGSLTVPSLDFETWKANSLLDTYAINTSSRLILLTVQMLISAYLKNKTFDVYMTDANSSAEIELHKFLRTMHLRSAINRSQQKWLWQE